MKLLRNVSAVVARTLVSHFAGVVVFLGGGLSTLELARADAPQVQFDMPYSVAARDVTCDDFRLSFPHEKLVEVKLQVSSLLVAGDERDLRQYLFRIVSPQHSMQVADYLPKTEHESPLAGNLAVEKSDEKSASLGINVSGQYEIGVDPSVNGGAGQKSTSSVKYELLPPKESVSASGTILRGTGVYFKLKGSDRNLLEGARDVALVLRVPTSWRADYLYVRCEADGYARSFTRSLDSVVSAGERDFLVVVYQEGDEVARGMAEEMARRESSLRRVTALKAHEFEKRSSPGFAKLLAFSPVQEKGPSTDEWLRRVLFGGTTIDSSLRVPKDVRQAAEAYSTARSQVVRLNGWDVRRQATAALVSDEMGRR